MPVDCELGAADEGELAAGAELEVGVAATGLGAGVVGAAGELVVTEAGLAELWTGGLDVSAGLDDSFVGAGALVVALGWG